MHIVVKHTLALFGLYLLVVIGLAFFISQELAEPVHRLRSATSPAQDTVRAYKHVYEILLLTALCGLATIAALGAILQARLRRTGADPTNLAEAAARPHSQPSPNPGDDFAGVSSAAYRLGNESSLARVRAMRAQACLDTLANALEVGVILVTPDGRPSLISPRAKALLAGDSADEIDVRFAELRAQVHEYIESSGQAGGSSAKQFELTQPSGTVKRLRAELHPLGSTGTEDCLWILVDSDTSGALTEEDLLAATRARGISELYAAAAHDLRAPLNAVSLHLEMLKRSLAADDASAPARRMHYTGAMENEFMRLKDLLQSFLELNAPAQAGRGVMNLNQVIDRLAVLISAQARRQRVQLEFDLPATPAHVYGNADYLQQALLNVTLNALEHAAQDGRVDVRLRVDLTAVLVSICDNGPGIPPGLQSRIFDLHFTTKDGRSGIGLYVARVAVEAHGGHISVESDAGPGACFYISLPLHVNNEHC
jgi:signal transduction histidine kinase